ncbi:pollen receptor like kinase 1 [Hibiscus trionum]|uniref:Pollen receptor like kinase 1 n=1 Tax=Hibiscus trionum TaxID=183268 RepID=A0A9W7HAY5_HIBTR|nr:pollen receptor like kinase 1 [Hibiscus trionum]
MATSHLRLILFSISTSMLLFSSHSLSEPETLLKFKASLKNAGGLGWEKNPKPPCDAHRSSWVGVVCMNSSVLGIQLEGLGISGTIDVDTLSGFPNLKSLSFMNNNFQGSMPDFRKLKDLKSLYLSKNQFSGDIPADAFKGLIKMMKLYLSENKFTGEIPSSVLELPKLKELKLDGNRFSGRVPDFKQTNLQVVNLSNNALEGSIPEKLRKMDTTMFSGNKGLCGAPLKKKCDSPPPPSLPSPPSPQPSLSPTAVSSPPFWPPPPRPLTTSMWIIMIIFLAGGLIIFSILTVLLIGRRRTQASSTVEAPPPKTQKAEPVKLCFLMDDREKFDLTELLKSSAEVLGSGSFGASYKAATPTGPPMVVKRFQQMNNVGKEEFHEHLKSLGRLRHKNLLPIIAYFYRKDEKLLVSDFVHNGSLAVHLHGHQSLGQPPLDWATRLSIVKGVAKGLDHLYKELPGLVAPHGHLKSSNVLLNQTLQPLLTDYSLTPVVNQETAQEHMVAYKSPEYIKTGRITKKTDVWSLGVLILEILTGKFPGNLLQKGKGNDDQDLAVWVKSIVGDDAADYESKLVLVLDKDMEEIREGDKKLAVDLLGIGLSCCDLDMEKRLDLKEAVERIEGLKVEDDKE